MRILIYDEVLSGHHLEFLQIYCKRLSEKPDDEFIVCIPEHEYHEKKDNLPSLERNIRYELLPPAEVVKMRCGSSLNYGFRKAKSIVSRVKKYNADVVILTDFITTIPMLLFLMPRGVRVRGIIYRVYLYLKGKVSWCRYLFDSLCCWLMARSSVMDRVFILNDEYSAIQLNNRHHTDKFHALSDPIADVDRSKLEDLHNELSISQDNTVFFHFGVLSLRKGTLEILKAICMSDNVLQYQTFVFAGIVKEEIHDEFYKLLDIAKQKAQIIVFDEFCSYTKIFNLCYTADFLLMPYQQTELSSGILGYAALFEKPVIGPKEGLIGRLISDNHLGLTLDNVSASGILGSLKLTPTRISASGYLEKNSRRNFITTLWDGI